MDDKVDDKVDENRHDCWTQNTVINDTNGRLIASGISETDADANVV